MKFITEAELRDLYKKEPFTTYILNPDIRITPGARQFLADRRIELVRSDQCNGGKKPNHDSEKQIQSTRTWGAQKLYGILDRMEALFLLIAAEILQVGDPLLSEEVMALGKSFQKVRKAESEKAALESFEFWGWSEEEIKQRGENLKTYVELTEFHVGVEKGREAALINYLRASLQEVEPAVLEVYWDEEGQACTRQDLIDRINVLISILYIMMWKCLGGKKWRQ